MNRSFDPQVEALFHEAAELPLSQREEFLREQRCDTSVIDQVRALLQHDDDGPATFLGGADTKSEEQIGPYKLGRLLGEGGMGSVYEAEQHSPVHRTVAIKLMKLGMNTREFVARFESERQALAMMDHPGVARVFDAGSTDAGRPYFVMEYAPGQPIVEYCDTRRLNIRQRLQMFIEVCDAVEHAHRKGIIHRDIKNSNVLVTEIDGKPLPKVIDFGVAKAINQRLSEHPLQTEQGQLIGTPEYMSPEQAERGALDIDTRSDIYSIGVLLYELMAGVHPIPSDVLRSGGYDHVQRILRETDLPRPSTRLSSLGGAATRVAECRRTPLPTLLRELRSELEWIPLKAMRKDREQRYRGAAELGDDLRNYLNGRPLIAGPESRTYRARKFLRRHSGAVAALVAMLILLVGGIAATTWQAVRATRAGRTASEALDEARNANAGMRAVNDFLTQDLLGSANPAVSRGEDLTIRKALDTAAGSVGTRFKDRPPIEASIRNTLAETYHTIGRSDLGLPHAQVAFELRRRLLGDDHPETLESMIEVATQLNQQGEFADAETLARQSLGHLRQLREQDHRQTVLNLLVLCTSLKQQSKHAQAREFDEEALRICLDHLGEQNGLTLTVMENRAAGDHFLGRYDRAEPLLRKAVAGRRILRGNDHPDTLGSISTLAFTLQRLHQYDEAEQLYRESLQTRRRILGNDHPHTVESMINLADLYQHLHRPDDAERLLREALDTNRRLRRDDLPTTAASMNNLASILQAKGELAEAESLFRQVVQRCGELFGQNHPYTLGTMKNLAKVLSEQGKLAEAEPIFAEVFRRTPQIEHDPKWKAIYMCGWGVCLARMQRYAAAEPPLREAYEQLQSTAQHDTTEMREVTAALADVCEHTNRPDEAAKWRRQLATIQPASQPASR